MAIACEHYSQLELAAMQGQTVALYIGDTLSSQGKVSDLVTEKGKEFLVSPDKQKIPLDDVTKIENIK